MDLKLLEQAKSILKDNSYMTLALSSLDSKPWIFSAYFSFDNELNLYWYSSKNSKHSKIIDENSYLAITIFNSSLNSEAVDALYFEALAFEIDDPEELQHAVKIYGSRVHSKDVQKIKKFESQYEDFKGISLLRMYKAVPQKVYKLGESKVMNEKFIDLKTEIELDALKKFMREL